MCGAFACFRQISGFAEALSVQASFVRFDEAMKALFPQAFMMERKQAAGRQKDPLLEIMTSPSQKSIEKQALVDNLLHSCYK